MSFKIIIIIKKKKNLEYRSDGYFHPRVSRMVSNGESVASSATKNADKTGKKKKKLYNITDTYYFYVLIFVILIIQIKPYFFVARTLRTYNKF